MEPILTDCVQSSLRHFMYRNAIFTCERLCAEFPSETNLQLLASCYLQNNQAYSAYHILKGSQLPQSRYLFALSCFQMDLLNEAEMAMCPANESMVEVPNGAAGHYLLGLIYRYTDRRKCAVHHFNQALSLDPLLWVAYEELCMLGVAEDAATVFGDAAFLCLQKQQLSHGLVSKNLYSLTEDHVVATSKSFGSEDASPRHFKNCQRDISGHHHGLPLSGGNSSQPSNGGSASVSFYTPSPMAIQLSGVSPPRMCRNMQINGPFQCPPSTDNSPRSIVNSMIQAPKRKVVDEGKLRKVSGRLFSDSSTRRSTRLAGESVAYTNLNVPAAVSVNGTGQSSKYPGNSKLSHTSSRSVTLRRGQSWANENLDESDKPSNKQDIYDDPHCNSAACSSPSGELRGLEREISTLSGSGAGMSSTRLTTGASELLALLRVLGEGLRLSCLYKSQDALDVYVKLPQKHYNTGWVLSQVGKAYFEMVDYLEADHAFSLARLASPYNMEGMDIYSTVLYHLKEDMKLSYLAQELISTDRLATQSWCAMGNCYSLQKDHETALKNFQRAVQLNPRFAYAHTLCGHEYVALEDFENGVKSYQSALRVDARHYNAWYGLGMVYFRQEKFEFSEHHFRVAFQINPRSSVIMSYLGAALHALKKNKEALEMMERAIIADKKNPLPLYQKANILLSMENLDGALEVLEELKEYAPRESSVYALMGRIYKRRNMYDKAMLHFGLSLDLKPSATDVAAIKAAIEKLHVPDEIEDSL